MISSKQINKVIVVLISLSLFACGLIFYFGANNLDANAMEYESKLFGDEILTIDIQVDEEDWAGLLSNPEAKEYIPADLTINGETFNTVGLRTKGNSSLTQVAQMNDSDRYSLHLKFNKYQKGRTYYGLDTFCLNNIIADTTYMKDYLSYDIMNYIGVPSPRMNYAKVTVNGKYQGFYIALERYEKSFLNRVFGTINGELYNVKIQMGQRDQFMVGNDEQGDAFDFPQDPGNNWPNQNMVPGDGPNKGGLEFPNRRDEGFPGGVNGRSSGLGGGNLVYTDDQISSYSNIFDNAEFKKNSDKDKQRVITALKNLNEGTNLEKYFDVDEILRYLAAHTVVVNLDSYSSSMAQNYYIYELDGKISILPWDYNLAFGGFQGGEARDTINFPIDTPVSGVSMEDRPLINKLLEVPEYKEKYHRYLREIVDGYFNSGLFAETIAAIDAKINDFVRNDTTSFTSYEEYTAALPILRELGTRRAQSIEGQLNGTIPSTTSEQGLNKDSLIDGEGINLLALGTFIGGKGNNRGEQETRPQGGQDSGDRFDNPGEIPDMTVMAEVMSILRESRGIIDDKVRQELLALGLTEEQIQQLIDMDMTGGSPVENPGALPGRDETERQSREPTQTKAATASSNAPVIILTIVLLLITAATTFLISRFKRSY